MTGRRERRDAKGTRWDSVEGAEVVVVVRSRRGTLWSEELGRDDFETAVGSAEARRGVVVGTRVHTIFEVDDCTGVVDDLVRWMVSIVLDAFDDAALDPEEDVVDVEAV